MNWCLSDLISLIDCVSLSCAPFIIPARKAFQDKWKCGPWTCNYVHKQASGMQDLAYLTSVLCASEDALLPFH